MKKKKHYYYYYYYLENSLFSLTSNALQIVPILLDAMSLARTENRQQNFNELSEILKIVFKRTQGKRKIIK